jgi:DNA-binding winged helix-turn-helix (wHTH) protein
VPAPRYRFGPFIISPAHRVVRREGREVPLIPRYFDLLVLLIAERHRAVTRQDIFDRVWSDVVVSDGALSQAVRTIRRILEDDPREPVFIRTVARHGYQFVYVPVTEEADEGPLSGDEPNTSEPATLTPDPFAPLLDRLLCRGDWQQATGEERREAAEQLHALGTAETLRRLDALPGHQEARAILRDARWDVPGAGEVPLVGERGAVAAIVDVIRLRARRAARLASNRWAAASAGGAIAGAIGGITGGCALWLLPESMASSSLIVALGLVGLVTGAIGAAGVGAGLAAAEALARSARGLALAMCGAAGGAMVGGLAHLAGRAVLEDLFGRHLASLGGGVEGLALGAAAGIGYAVSTSSMRGGGMATPRGAARGRTALITGLACAVAAVLLTLSGRHLVGSSLDVIATAFEGSNVGLAPLARLLGEEELRPVTRMIVSGYEGLLFGAGLAFGLTHRPRTPGI